MGGRRHRDLPIAGLTFLNKMQTALNIRNSSGLKGDRPFLPGLILMGLAVVVALFGVLASSGAFDAYPYLFLLPWIFGLAVVMAVPSAVLYYQGNFTFADPLVFATVSYFFPAFVVGGIFFAGGWSQPVFLPLIQDVQYTLPLTIVLVGLGFAGLSAGYFSPIGSKPGRLIGRSLPSANYPSSSLIVPAILLFLLGLANLFFAYYMGRLGYQMVAKVNSYDGLIFLSSTFWLQASVLLWLIVFREKKIRLVHLPVILCMVATSVANALLSGSRAGIIQILMTITLAFVLSGRKFKLKHTVAAAVVFSAALVAGMIYGTTFRHVKGIEETQSLDRYAENVLNTFDEVGKSNLYDTVAYGFYNITERVDILSTLAVVVSNYEELAPYEEAYGLDNNIWVDSTTFFVPRVIWEDKPVASDARKYSDLYFDFGGSSFAITPIGDLLRNFGIAGVPLGMFVLGIVLRFIYTVLVEGQMPAIWRLNLYFMLLITVSYEGFYGTIIPSLSKIGFTAVIGILIVNFLAKRVAGGKTAVQ